MQWSPRFGFNWDVTGDQMNQLRGGTGIFMARPAYVWLSNVFGNSGVNGYGNLTCNHDGDRAADAERWHAARPPTARTRRRRRRSRSTRSIRT